MFVDASAIVAILTSEPEADSLADLLEAALDAFSRYGKGRGHPAQLNLGDCFAYAMTKNHHTSLLYKGEDFAKTDLQSLSRA